MTTPISRPHLRLVGRVGRVRLAGLAALACLLATLAGPAPARAANGDCGQPVSSGSGPTATDCSYVLRSAVGSLSCELCVCDINGNSSLNTTDALVCLKKAVGQDIALDCPPCGATTTTMDDGPDESTTSTSTTSTTTTIPVRCSSNSDCSALPEEFRCNPHTETCEKPCTRNADCHDFYLCNKTTMYCEEPDLLF